MEIVFDYRRKEDSRAPGEPGREGPLVSCLQQFIAHELPNQLVPIQAFARMLLQYHREALDEDGRRMLDQIATLTQRADKLSKRLAEIGRLLREPPWGPPLALAAATREAAAEVNALGATARVVYDVQSDWPCVHASRRLLHQVLIQLLRNASQAMGEKSSSGPGPGVVVVGGERAEGGVRWWVRDEGRGLTESQIGLFEPFAAGRFPGAAGPGLGLFLVCQAAGLWRGALRVCSEVGQGSTFSLFIPDLADARSPTGPGPAAPVRNAHDTR